MYIRTHTHIHKYMHTHIHTLMYIYTHIHIYTHMHKHIHIYIHSHIHIYIYIYITTNLEYTPHAAPAPPLSTPNMQLPAGYLQLKLILKKLLKFHTRGKYKEMMSWKNLLLTVLLM